MSHQRLLPVRLVSTNSQPQPSPGHAFSLCTSGEVSRSDADSATVPDVPVEVVTVPSGELVAADVTNALGRAVFSVEAGVYDVRAELPPGSVLQPGFTNPARVEVPPGEVGWASFNLE